MACYGLVYFSEIGAVAAAVSKILNWITSSIAVVLWGRTVDGSATTNSTQAGMETYTIGPNSVRRSLSSQMRHTWYCLQICILCQVVCLAQQRYLI